MTTSLKSWYACIRYEDVAKTGIPLAWRKAEAYGKASRDISERKRRTPKMSDGPQARSLAFLSIPSHSSDIHMICFCSSALCILHFHSLPHGHSCDSIHFACRVNLAISPYIPTVRTFLRKRFIKGVALSVEHLPLSFVFHFLSIDSHRTTCSSQAQHNGSPAYHSLSPHSATPPVN